MLRPCLYAAAVSDKWKASKGSSSEIARQHAADGFWKWAESRIVSHTDQICERSVKLIVDNLVDRSSIGSRMRVILSQSAITLEAVSPFDRLATALASRKGVFPVRISGSANPTIEAVQQALVQAVLGVTSSIVFSDSSATGVPLKGLDASIVEELGLGHDLAVIVEDADALGRDLLFDIIKLVYYLQKKLPNRMDLILNTDLGEPWIEEVVCDERIFADLDVQRIPLINARELNSRIRSIFFNSASESRLQGYPISLADVDSEFLSRDLPLYTLSPMELSCHILLMVSNWYKNCELSCLTDASRAEQDVKKYQIELPSQLMKKGVLSESMDNFIQGRKRLAVLGRLVAVLAKSIRGSDDGSLTITEAMLRFGEASLVNQCVLDLQSKWRSGRKLKEIGSDIECLSERLSTQLISDFGFSSDDPAIIGMNEFTRQAVALSQRNFAITEAGEEFFKLIKSYIETELKEARNLKVSEELVAALTSVKGLEQPESLMTHVGYFDPAVAFLRESEDRVAKSKIAQEGLKKMHAVARVVFGKQQQVVKGKKSAKKPRTGKENCSSNNDVRSAAEAKKVTPTYCDFDYLTQFVKKDDDTLAESLATLEFLGLIRPPGFVDLGAVAGANGSRIRKLYRDTYLAETGEGNEEDELVA